MDFRVLDHQANFKATFLMVQGEARPDTVALA